MGEQKNPVGIDEHIRYPRITESTWTIYTPLTFRGSKKQNIGSNIGRDREGGGQRDSILLIAFATCSRSLCLVLIEYKIGLCLCSQLQLGVRIEY